jgi:hypothetical protein
MHDCQKYREDWVAGLAEEFVDCDDCRVFCQEAAAILQATDAAAQPLPELSEEYWNGFENRLRNRLVLEKVASTTQVYWKWGALAAAAAIAVVVTWGAMRSTQPIASAPEKIKFDDSHIAGLDPMVVVFLGQSEMFLRNFTKIQPSYVEDLDDAQMRARQDLMEIAQQKALAGDFVPVRIALDEYESVLREIKNLDSPQDLTDLQKRIYRNGLIANLKAYQPHVMLVSQRVGD